VTTIPIGEYPPTATTELERTMTEHPEDAWHRLDHLRNELARADAAVHELKPQAHASGVVQSERSHDLLTTALTELATASRDYADAAERFAHSLSAATS
jgi:hypothetical protein